MGLVRNDQNEELQISRKGQRVLSSAFTHSGFPEVGMETAFRSRYVDLSHAVEAGMITHKGLPGPVICDFMSREQSKQFYEDGTSFQIGKIEMIANTGTYVDSPFHRFENGKDISELAIEKLVDLPAVVVRADDLAGRAVDRDRFLGIDVAGKAVLVYTGWAGHWGTEQYLDGHPFLTAAAAAYLKEKGAGLVGIDSMNIDDTSDGRRPVHTMLLGAEIPIAEHLCALDLLPRSGFAFNALPVKVKGFGTFPVRAFAKI